MNVGEIMTRSPCRCTVDDSLERAAQLMWEHDCGALPVVDRKGRVLAMLTDRDVCMAAYAQGRALAEIPVAIAASHALHVASEVDAVEVAAALMRAHRVRRLPVVGRDGALVGVVSLGDLARRVGGGPKREGPTADAVARTLATICMPRREASAVTG